MNVWGCFLVGWLFVLCCCFVFWGDFFGGICFWILNITKQTRLKKNAIFNKTRRYNIQMFDKIIVFNYRMRKIKATEMNKLLILTEMAA